MLKNGDICTYSYDDLEDNKSFCIVKVTEVKSDEISVVKFLKVLNDDSGNGMFEYLLKTNGTMNVSNKYLKKITTSEEIFDYVMEGISDVISEMVDIMFDDNKSVCGISNCYKGGAIPCGADICKKENVELWKNKIKERGVKVI